MIPPVQQIRLRSIQTWLKNQPDPETGSPLSSEALSRKAKMLDEQMIQEFDTRTSLVLDKMAQTKEWGSEAATQAYRTRELEIWQEIVSESLPATTEPQSDT